VPAEVSRIDSEGSSSQGSGKRPRSSRKPDKPRRVRTAPLGPAAVPPTLARAQVVAPVAAKPALDASSKSRQDLKKYFQTQAAQAADPKKPKTMSPPRGAPASLAAAAAPPPPPPAFGEPAPHAAAPTFAADASLTAGSTQPAAPAGAGAAVPARTPTPPPASAKRPKKSKDDAPAGCGPARGSRAAASDTA
jgi:hypothetical protein